MGNTVGVLISEEDQACRPGTRLDHSRTFVSGFYQTMKRDRETSDVDNRKRMESAPVASLSKGVIYFFKTGYYDKSRECLKVLKILQNPLP